jgi:hypothetical protein
MIKDVGWSRKDDLSLLVKDVHMTKFVKIMCIIFGKMLIRACNDEVRWFNL